ncbi:hypothetical protein D3C76_704620 [compost metagenome]
MRGYRVLGIGNQVEEPLGRGRYANHHRHPHQPHFRVAQQESLHQGLRGLRAFTRSHASVCLVDHHVKTIRNSPRSIGQRFPDQMLAAIASVGQRLIDGQLLRVDEVDAATLQARRVEIRVDGDKLVNPIHLVRLTLDLELGLLVELGHIRYPQNHGIGLRCPVQRPGQLVVGLIQNGLEQRRHHDGLTTARGRRKGHHVLIVQRHPLSGFHQSLAQIVQRVFLKIEQRDLHARTPCVPVTVIEAAARSWFLLIMKLSR